MSDTVSSGQTISLRGSTDIVTQFFEYSVNSILYQRGIYPPETFKRVSQYGLSMMVTTDDAVREYIQKIMQQLQTWLLSGDIQKLILVVKGIETGDVLERWGFEVQAIHTYNENAANLNLAPMSTKSDKEITGEIQAIMRQITASVTFLPLLNEPCCFDLLVYTDKHASVPVSWADSDPCLIMNGEDVRLRSFDTKIHKIGASVSYRLEDGI